MSGKLLLKPSEAAELCGKSVSAIYRDAAAGVIPSVKWGRSVRIPKQQLLEWIVRNTVESK